MFESLRNHKVTIFVLIGTLCVFAFITYQFVAVSGVFSDLKNDLKTIEPEQGSEYLDIHGNSVQMSEFKGRPLIVNSWATWSPYSKDELSLLTDIQRDYDDIVVLAINRKENLPIISSYLKTYNINIEGLIFLSDTTDHFYTSSGGYAMPETIFYRKDGTIHTHVRGTLDRETANNIVKELLN